jgi:hypothetical protein
MVHLFPTDHQERARACLLLNLIAVGIAAVALAIYAFVTIHMNGIYTLGSEVGFIRQNNPIRLIQPEWVGGADIFWNWTTAEIRARLALVAAAWVVSSGFVIWRYFKKTKLNPSSGSL